MSMSFEFQEVIDTPKHPPGTIGIVCDHTARYTDFYISLQGVKSPPGSRVDWSRGGDVVQNCNLAVEKMGGEWIWIMGDDHAFEEDALMRLLDREVDIVVPICVRKNPPFDPVVYNKLTETGYKTINLTDYGPDDLIEIEAAGSAGMLIRKHVLDALESPCFARAEIQPGLTVTEDLYFCYKARQAGFKIHCDLNVALGHIRPITIIAVYKDGEWGRTFDFGTGQGIFVADEDPI